MLSSLSRGIGQANRSKAMILVLLVASIFFALPIAVSVFLLVVRTTGGTFAPTQMLANDLDPLWLIDLINERFAGASLTSEMSLVILLTGVMSFFYQLASVLFAGGILTVFETPDGRFSHQRFWAGAGKYFPRFLRLWLISLVFYGAVFIGYALALIPITTADERASTEYTGVVLKLIATGALLVVLAVINMIFDYARIGAVVHDRRRMFRELILAGRFALTRRSQTCGLYLLIALLGLIIFAIIVWLRNAIPQSSLITVFIATILGQLAIASRLWTRLTFYAAELDLYRRLMPPPEDAPMPGPPPGPHFPEFARASEPSEGPPPRGLFGEGE
jgi:hypothetical protein